LSRYYYNSLIFNELLINLSTCEIYRKSLDLPRFSQICELFCEPENEPWLRRKSRSKSSPSRTGQAVCLFGCQE